MSPAAPYSPQAQIKQLLLGLSLSSPPLVQAQLSEALSIICSYDFPARWPELLPELVSKLHSDDPAVIKGVLAVGRDKPWLGWRASWPPGGRPYLARLSTVQGRAA